MAVSSLRDHTCKLQVYKFINGSSVDITLIKCLAQIKVLSRRPKGLMGPAQPPLCPNLPPHSNMLRRT